MSFSSVPDQQVFIENIAHTIESNTTIFPENGTKLLTKVLRNAPAQDTSPELTVPPYCYVTKSRTPPRVLRQIGRGTRNSRGPTLYEYEFYCVVILQSVLRSKTDQGLTAIAALIRKQLDTNMRLVGSNNLPICRRIKTYEIPYVIGQDTPDYQAINVVVRVEVNVENS